MNKSTIEAGQPEQEPNNEQKDQDKQVSPSIANALVGRSLVAVHEALYNPMTWESGYVTLSVHLSKEGAEKAIAFHKMEKIKKWLEMYPEKEEEPYEFGEFEDWAVREIIVLP